MRFTLGIIMGTSLAAGVLVLGCYRQSYDPNAPPNSGVTLTGATLDTPPPPPSAVSGPTDYAEPAPTHAVTGGAAPRTPALTTSRAGAGRSAATSPAARTDTSGVLADRAPAEAPTRLARSP